MKTFLKFLLFAAIIVVLVVLFTDSIGAPVDEEAQIDEMSQEESMDSTEEEMTSETEEDISPVESETELEGSIILGGDSNNSSEESTQ